MGTPESSREPCPHRILFDTGGSFAMGAIGGSGIHFIKGLLNSPRGARLAGGCEAVRMNSPRVAGSFAAWGGLFSTFDCTLVYLRRKEDPWNSIIAGAAAGGLLNMRRGIRASAGSALVGAGLLALMEGSGIVFNKLYEQHQQSPLISDEPPPPNLSGFPGYASHLPTQPGPEATFSTRSSSDSGSGTWFGRWFGSGKKKESQASSSSSGSQTKILESFDAPPVPSFEFK